MQLPKMPIISTGKKKTRQIVGDNPIEAIRSVGQGLKNTASEESKAAVNEAWEQLLGLELKLNNKGGELSAGEEIDLTQVKKETHGMTEMGEEYRREVIHAGKIANQENGREIQVKVHEILIELKQLAQSTQEVQAEAEIITQETTVETAGKYNLNFLENMLSWLRDARENVEDSLAWFQSLRSKKASRQYHTMAKKHGTSFTQANERSQSVTSVG